MTARATLQRELVTPEGVALPFELAGAGERLVAFTLDVLRIALLTLALGLASTVLPDSIRFPVLILGFFLITQFYFTWFEITRQGRTPGKRSSELRVMDRRGGRLAPAAIFTRNVTRLFEIQLPLVLLLQPRALGGDAAPAWVTLAGFGWVLALGLLPLLNRDRLRLGDLIAGTIVVHTPKAILLRDLAERAARRDTGAGSEFAFAPEQLAIYGIYELQALEQVLRRNRPDRERALELVCERVLAKIGWPESPPVDPERFLTAFYAAQRARLEQDLLLGERRERKTR